MMGTTVVKSAPGKVPEAFDPIKLHGSIAAACLSVRSFEGEAHMTAQRVCEKVLEWLEEKAEVTAHDVRRVTSNHLRIYHPEAAYIYEQYGAIV
jgi:hypothetical protein